MNQIIYEVLFNPLTWGSISGIIIYNIIHSRRKHLSPLNSLLQTLFFVICAFLGILTVTYIMY